MALLGGTRTRESFNLIGGNGLRRHTTISSQDLNEQNRDGVLYAVRSIVLES